MSPKRKLSKIEKIGLICIAVIAAFYGYLKIVYDPTSQKLAEVRTQNAVLNEEVAAYMSTPALAGLKSKTAQLELEHNNLSEELDGYIMQGKNLTQEEVTRTLASVNDLILSHSLRVTDITQKDTAAGKDSGAGVIAENTGETAITSGEAVSLFNWKRYEMALSGSYSDLTDFFESLKELDSYIYIWYVDFKIDVSADQYIMFIILLI